MTATAEAATDAKAADLPDERIGALLDAVDERTAAQNRLHDELGEGFLWLARERYRDALAIERLGQVARDGRDMQASKRVAVSVDGDGTAHWARDAAAGGVGGDEASHSGGGGGDATASAPGLRRRRGGGGGGGGGADKGDVGTGAADGPRQAGMRRGASRYVGIPSAELREAVGSFERAVDAAIALAGVQTRVAATVGEPETEGDAAT